MKATGDHLAKRSRLLLIGLLALPVMASGCGSGSPEQAAPPPELPRPIATPEPPPPASAAEPERRRGEAASASSRPRSAFGIAAEIRAHLAQRFLYASWYPEIREVKVGRGTATVSTWHLGGSDAEGTARRICAAVLGTHQVQTVRVRYEGGSDACP